MYTSDPWTATPALIKVDDKIYTQKLFKNGAIFWEKAKCVCTIVQTATKKALFFGPTTAVVAVVGSFRW